MLAHQIAMNSTIALKLPGEALLLRMKKKALVLFIKITKKAQI